MTLIHVIARRPRPERWRLAGWLGGVPAAEWQACASVMFTTEF